MTAPYSRIVRNIVWLVVGLFMTQPASAQAPVATSIAAGYEHTLIAKPDGTVWAFGDYVTWSGCDTATGSLGPLTLVGRYHTHGAFGNVGMSYGDAGHAQNDPERRWFVSSPCGGIYEYSQFTVPRPWYRWLESETALEPIYGKEIGKTSTPLSIQCPIDIGLQYPPL